jgi:hypothetical protein
MSFFPFGFSTYGLLILGGIFATYSRLLVLCVVIVSICALMTSRSRQYYGHHRSSRCPRCGHHFPKLRNEESGETIPEGGFVCEHCGCKMDEFGNELSIPADSNNPENW